MSPTRYLALSMLIASSTAIAGTDTMFVLNGFGQDQCGQYVEAYRLGSSGYAPYISYVQGNASALSQQTALRTGELLTTHTGRRFQQ
jgi:hypothetical protein